MLANPQSRCGSPSFLLILLFGTVRGIKIDIILHLAIGLCGAYALARNFKLDRIASSVAAGVFMWNAAYATTVSYGMSWALAGAYIPWAWLGYRLAAEKLIYAWAAALPMALIILNGGAYLFVIASVLLAALAAVDTAESRRFAHARACAAIFILTIALGAFKLFPAIVYLQNHPRPIDEYSGYSISGFLLCLFDPAQQSHRSALYLNGPGFWTGTSYAADENLMYAGMLAGLFIIIGFLSSWPGKWKLLVVTLILFMICLGDRPSPSLWALMHRFPPFDAMRVAQRFRFALLLCLALAAAFGLARASAFAERFFASHKSAVAVSALAAFVVFGDLLINNSNIFETAFTIPPIPVKRAEQFQQIRGLPFYTANGSINETPPPEGTAITNSALYPALLSNLGTVNAYETMTTPRNAVPHEDPKYRGEVYLDIAGGSAEFVKWSPNELRVAVHSPGAARIIINQNYDSGWTAADGRPVDPTPEGLLSTGAAAGDGEVTLVYRPAAFVWGCAITLAAIAGAIFTLVFSRGRAA